MSYLPHGIVFFVLFCVLFCVPIGQNISFVFAHEQSDSTATIPKHIQPQFSSDTGGIHHALRMAERTRRTSIRVSSEYAHYGLSLARSLDYPIGICDALTLLAGICIDQGNYTQAMSYALEAQRLSDEESLQEQYGRALATVASIHRMQNNLTKALDFSRQALSLQQRIGDMRGEAISLSNLGSTFRRLGVYDSALYYRTKSLDIFQRITDSVGMADANMGIANILRLQLQPAQSLDFERRALSLYQSMGNQFGIADAETALGRSFLANKQFDSSQQYSEQGYKRSMAIGAGVISLRACEDLSDLHKQKGDFKTAFLFHKRFASLRDSIFSTEQATRLSEMQSVFDGERREQERASTRYQRNVVIGMLLLVLVLLAVLVNRYRLKQRSEAILRQQQEAIAFENHRAETLLLSIFPAAIAERLKSGERAIADHYDSVTVLFADIVGFTKLSQEVSPKSLVQGLNSIFEQFDEVAKKYGLEKIKTIGDAYMVAGGLPERSHDHCERVARMALEMQEILKTTLWNNGKEPHQYHHHNTHQAFQIQVRIGIHTGEAVAGVIGTSKFSYDIWGNTVNMASRMESHGEAGKIHVSDEVYRALQGHSSFDIGQLPNDASTTNDQSHDPATKGFHFEERGEIEIKGKGLMRTWFLT